MSLLLLFNQGISPPRDVGLNFTVQFVGQVPRNIAFDPPLDRAVEGSMEASRDLEIIPTNARTVRWRIDKHRQVKETSH